MFLQQMEFYFHTPQSQPEYVKCTKLHITYSYWWMHLCIHQSFYWKPFLQSVPSPACVETSPGKIEGHSWGRERERARERERERERDRGREREWVLIDDMVPVEREAKNYFTWISNHNGAWERTWLKGYVRLLLSKWCVPSELWPQMFLVSVI